MTTAERAAAPLLPQVAARRPGAPGQFAFATSPMSAAFLQDSGWAGIDIRPSTSSAPCPKRSWSVTSPGSVLSARIIDEADERTRTRVIETVRAAFDPYVDGDEVRFTAACWMVGARASSMSATPEGAGDA